MNRLERACLANFSTSIVIATVLFIASSVGCRQAANDTNLSAADARADVAPVHLTDANFEQEVIECEILVVVDVWAPWCQPCIEMQPALRQLTSALKSKVKVAELNADNNAFIKTKYGIDHYPTLLIFNHGVVVTRLVGLQTVQNLQSAVQSAYDSENDLEKLHEL